MARFYLDTELEINQSVYLPSDVLQHINVLRLRKDEIIEVFNGDGTVYSAQLIEISKRNAIINILSKQIINNESGLKLNLYCSLIVSDKFELVIQKTVELGVNKIIPIICCRTQGISSERIGNKLNHWNKISLMATEQSGRAVLTPVLKPILIDGAMKIPGNNKFILSPHHDETLIPIQEFVKEIDLFVGPEGGFTKEEIELARNNNICFLKLGPRIMRAETAAIVATSFMQAKYGDINFMINE